MCANSAHSHFDFPLTAHLHKDKLQYMHKMIKVDACRCLSKDCFYFTSSIISLRIDHCVRYFDGLSNLVTFFHSKSKLVKIRFLNMSKFRASCFLSLFSISPWCERFLEWQHAYSSIDLFWFH